MGTNNGGIYVERGATFYTYQRRVPQDSTLTLEELFRHEYTHYLNGRWAVPGMFGDAPWYTGDLTTAMDEGTAEFFDGATRDDGIKVRKSLVKGVITDTAGGRPRMTVNQFLHATYDGDGFRFYDYAGTFFEFLWTEHPSLLREMYGYQRANDPKGFDAWRTRMGSDAAIQREYDAFLDEQIADVDGLYVPDTHFTPNGSLDYSRPEEVRSAFIKATGITPACTGNGDTNGRGSLHLHRPHHRQPLQLPERRPCLRGHVQDRRLLHPHPHPPGREQPGRHELLLRRGGHLDHGRRRLRRLHLRGTPAQLRRHYPGSNRPPPPPRAAR
ncbi:hypothetical protein GCM10020000_15130 [Streptomyces olivoverticillatus]